MMSKKLVGQMLRITPRVHGIASIAVVSLLLVGLGVLTTTVFTGAAAEQRERTEQQSRQAQSERLANYLTDQQAMYDQILLAASGIVNVRGTAGLQKSDWSRFVNSLQIDSRHPEILGIGYADYFTSSNLEAYIDTQRAAGAADFAIKPDAPRDEYTAIRYIEPLNDTNRGAIGYDMYAEAARRAAMRSARDTGATAITAPVRLVQDSHDPANQKKQSVLLYYPIYSSGGTPQTTEARQAQLSGFVYIALRVSDMMRSTDLNFGSGMYVLRDITGDTNETLYDIERGMDSSARTQTYKQNLAVFDRTWQSELYLANPPVDSATSPTATFVLGIAVSILLGGTVFMLLARRMHRVQSTHEQELQRTKDELLALTSHQLRTPASGVKQYVGMLLQGYFGELNDEQKTITRKALTANERQLEIIDQLLYVAKADAGQLLLSPDQFDLAGLTREVADNLRGIAENKSIRIVVVAPRKLSVYGDTRYIRMILENLVSNAIKYSYPNSAVRIHVRKHKTNCSVAVQDHGVGIDSHDQRKLFHKFERIENPLSRSEGGSGLGLFLAQRLAEAHQGSIEVVSTSGEGSTFTFTVPTKAPRLKTVAQLTDIA